MPALLAMIIASVVGYLPEAIFGDRLSTQADIILSLVLGTVAYAAALWWLKRLRGD